MLKNYIKIGIRNLRKNRVFSLINITGLSVSIAFCLLLYLHIQYERSFDSFHKEKDRLFRLEMSDINFGTKEPAKKHLFSSLTKDDDIINSLTFPLVVSEDMPAVFPEVKSVTPLTSSTGDLVRVNGKVFKEQNTLIVGEHFFEVLSFPLIKGNPAQVLAAKGNIVLSETVAKKYFGTADPIGKTIEIIDDEPRLFTVSGVAKDAPSNSSFQFDAVLPVKSSPGYDENIKERFNHMTHRMMVELKEGVSKDAFAVKMNKWVKTYFTDQYFADFNVPDKVQQAMKMQWYLRPLADAHFNASTPWGHYSNSKNIYQLACLVIIILLIASLNYVLLAVSNGAGRSQEVGVRKVMGATRRSVIMQFWVETQIVVVVAVAAGFVLAQLLLPLYNMLTGSAVSNVGISWWDIGLALLTLCVVLGLLAGYYPALILSRMRPVSILKSFQTFKVNPRFSRILVVAQYTACIVLMMAAFVINRQMRFISHKNLGFNKDQVLMVKNGANDSITALLKERLGVFAESEPSILGFAAMTGGLDGGGNRNGFKLNGEQQWLHQLNVDYDYFKLLGIEFVQGRPFNRNITADTSKTVRPSVVNETLFNMLGKEARIGEFNQTIRSTIIGVVKDYHFDNLAKKIQPQQHVLLRSYIRYYMFKIKAGEMQQAVSKIGAAWKGLASDYPFEYTFLDQDIASMYETEQQWQNIIQSSCFFAIIIACMGLFGLSAINAHNRTKEIGIRKVLGASVKDVVASLSGNFLLMVIIAVIIATPVAWWMMNKYLEDYAYRIDISWWMFVVVALAAILIALATVSFQAIKAAVANPVKSLRTE